MTYILSHIIKYCKALPGINRERCERLVISLLAVAILIPSCFPVEAAAQAYRIRNKKKTEEPVKEKTSSETGSETEAETGIVPENAQSEESASEEKIQKSKRRKGKKIEPKKKAEETPETQQEVDVDAQVLFPVVVKDTIPAAPDGAIITHDGDTIVNMVTNPAAEYDLQGRRVFNPDPTRAVWLSALFPGLGQIYNRRYWKIPIIIGGFLGLGYGTSWNNTQFQDYSQAYRDLLDNDPDTNSYMNFFPPTTTESSLDKSWLTSTMKSRKDFYRRNRDLCIICLAVLYLVCMVDAYVDASLAHFDISPNLSLDVRPALYLEPGGRKPSFGLNWAFNF